MQQATKLVLVTIIKTWLINSIEKQWHRRPYTITVKIFFTWKLRGVLPNILHVFVFCFQFIRVKTRKKSFDMWRTHKKFAAFHAESCDTATCKSEVYSE